MMTITNSDNASNFKCIIHNGIACAFLVEVEDTWLHAVTVPKEYEGQVVKKFYLYGDLTDADGNIVELGRIPHYVQIVNIPETVEEIIGLDSDKLFTESNLRKMVIDEDNPNYYSDKRAVYTKDGKKLIRFFPDVINSKPYDFEENYSVLDGTEIVGKNAFRGIGFLGKVTIPKSLQQVESGALLNCKKLKLAGKTSIENIADDAFDSEIMAKNRDAIIENNILVKYCSKGNTTYVIPDGIETIGKKAFSCEENKIIEKIVIPSSVKSIGSGAFYGCSGLRDIDLPESITSIGEEAFYKCEKLEQVILPGRIEKIENGLFKFCTALKSVKWPDKVTYFGGEVFYGCSNMEVISIPEGTRELNACSLTNKHTKTIVIPSTVVSISEYAWPDYDIDEEDASETLYDLEEIIVSEDNTEYKSVDGILYSKDGKKLLYAPCKCKLDKLHIPEGVEIITERALCGSQNIKELVIPKTVEEIEKEAFCRGLWEKVTFAGELEIIPESCFYACKKLKEVVLPTGLTEIEDYAFSECKALKKVEFPSSVEVIGCKAFEETAIKSVVLPENLTCINDGAFLESRLKKVTLPKTVKEIEPGVFAGCQEIEVYDSLDGESISTVGLNVWGYKGVMQSEWYDHTITVRSAETDEIKFQVWMGAEDESENYREALLEAWSDGSTFDFAMQDSKWGRLLSIDDRKKIAEYRLKYPIDLSDNIRKKYEKFLKENGVK